MSFNAYRVVDLMPQFISEYFMYPKKKPCISFSFNFCHSYSESNILSVSLVSYVLGISYMWDRKYLVLCYWLLFLVQCLHELPSHDTHQYFINFIELLFHCMGRSFCLVIHPLLDIELSALLVVKKKSAVTSVNFM